MLVPTFHAQLSHYLPDYRLLNSWKKEAAGCWGGGASPTGDQDSAKWAQGLLAEHAGFGEATGAFAPWAGAIRKWLVGVVQASAW